MNKKNVLYMKFKRTLVSLSALGIFASAAAPITVSAQSYYKQQTHLTAVEVLDEKELEDEIVASVSKYIIENDVAAQGPAIQPQAFSVGLMAALALKYGTVFVTTTLPKLIFSSVGIGGLMAQATFIKVFNNALATSTQAAFNRVMASGLKAAGVKPGNAETIAGAISTAVYLFV